MDFISGGCAPRLEFAEWQKGSFLANIQEPGPDKRMLQEFLGQKVVVDLRGPYVCLGLLHAMDEQFLDVRRADFHDLRDTHTTRENYIAASRATGIKRNRKRVLVVRSEVVAVSRWEDVIAE